MWQKTVIIFFIALVIFLGEQFLSGMRLPLNIFMAIALSLSLARFQLRWPLAILGGFLLDTAYGTYGINLLTLLVIVGLVSIMVKIISLNNIWACSFLIIGGVTASLLLPYGLTLIISLFAKGFSQYIIFLTFSQILIYLIVNFFAAGVMFLFLKKAINFYTL